MITGLVLVSRSMLQIEGAEKETGPVRVTIEASDKHGPRDLVRLARKVLDEIEERGFR